MTFFVVAVSEVCTQCICCHIILTLHHFLSHVVIVFEPCILFCLVVTSAIELFTLSLWLSPASSCFTLKGSFLHITWRHTKERCRSTESNHGRRCPTSDWMRPNHVSASHWITPLFAGHVAFLNANVFDPLTSLEEHASLHRIHSKSIIFNFVYFPIEWSSVLYFHSSHRLIL